MKNILAIIILAFCASSTSGQDIRFEASLDAKQLVLGDYFQITFSLQNANMEGFKAPSFKNFEVVGGPMKSSNISINNGHRSSVEGLTYALQPKKAGKFTIGSATVKVGKKTYKSNPVTIEVFKGKGEAANAKADLIERLDEYVFVKAETNVEEAYVGQQIVVEYKLYTAIGVESFDVRKEPEFKGFFAQEIQRFNNQVSSEVVNGKEYKTKVLRKVALFPQKEGLLEIDPMALRLGVSLSTKSPNAYSPFSRQNLMYHPVESKLIPIEIKALPKDAPANFTGAIGEYRMHCMANHSMLTTDDAITLTMTISGTGDVKRIHAPVLDLAKENFEVYEPQANSETYESEGMLMSEKQFQYMILPKKAGIYPFKPSFSYFSPDSSKYVTLQPQTYEWRVANGTKDPDVNKSPNAIVETETDIRFIKPATSLAKRGEPFFASTTFLTLTAMPFLALMMIVGFKQAKARKDDIDPVLLKQQKAQRVAKERLDIAKQHLDNNNSSLFYGEISTALWGYISHRLNMPTTELAKENVKEKLLGLNVNEAHIDHFLASINTCEMALFARMDNSSAMTKTYNDALDIIVNIEKDL